MATRQRFTTKQLRDLLAHKNVHSDFDLIGDFDGKVPFVMYRNGYKTRNVISAWQVLVVNRRTDPDGQFKDGFNKTFPLKDKHARVSALEEARRWATEQYGVNDWVKTPFGSWASKAHLEQRFKELLPQHFDPDYRDPVVQKIVDKLYGEDRTERMFRVLVQLYEKPEPPIYVSATSADNAHRQVTQLLIKIAGTRVLDGLKIHVNET